MAAAGGRPARRPTRERILCLRRATSCDELRQFFEPTRRRAHQTTVREVSRLHARRLCSEPGRLMPAQSSSIQRSRRSSARSTDSSCQSRRSTSSKGIVLRTDLMFAPPSKSIRPSSKPSSIRTRASGWRITLGVEARLPGVPRHGHDLHRLFQRRGETRRHVPRTVPVQSGEFHYASAAPLRRLQQLRRHPVDVARGGHLDGAHGRLQGTLDLTPVRRRHVPGGIFHEPRRSQQRRGHPHFRSMASKGPARFSRLNSVICAPTVE